MNRRIQVCLGEVTTPIGTLVYETSGNRENLHSMNALHTMTNVFTV
jgi:hypothetical protein